MAKKVVSIVDTAYRATLEEQDDTVVWFNHMLRQSGADITLLLTGNAVNYAVRGQQPPPLAFGTASIAFPPRKWAHLSLVEGCGVAQVSNLLYRRASSLRTTARSGAQT